MKMSGGDLECLYKACQAAATDGGYGDVYVVNIKHVIRMFK